MDHLDALDEVGEELQRMADYLRKIAERSDAGAGVLQDIAHELLSVSRQVARAGARMSVNTVPLRGAAQAGRSGNARA